jgi:large subunit ribosomal protein L7Ae
MPSKSKVRPSRGASGQSQPSKKSASKPSSAKKNIDKNPLIEKRPKNFGIGNGIQPKRDLSRYVKWPRYIRLQRQRKVLKMRMKVPPVLNQFNKCLDKPTAASLFKLLTKYEPETGAEKKERLLQMAEQKETNSKKPMFVKYGINHVTKLVETKKAKMVVIAHDVEPIEIVVWLPALCRKMGVPYCIVKGKARLGQIVHKKTATALALCDIKQEDLREFNALQDTIQANYNDAYEEDKKRWGGGIMGVKSNAREDRFRKLREMEEAKKAGMV